MIFRLRAFLALSAQTWTEGELLALAEYVGANVPLPESMRARLDAELETFPAVYRVWKDYTIETFTATGCSLEVPEQMFYAAARTLKAILDIIQESEMGVGTLVSKHSGKGVDPLKILSQALEAGMIHEEADFVSRVVSMNRYQQEVMLFTPIGKLDLSNVIGYFDGDAIHSLPRV